MEVLFKYLFIVALITTIFSCKKDNYDPPSATLSGHLLYQGDTIHVERNAVHFQIYQYGFGRVGQISPDETFAQDGSYSALLFPGDYKITIPSGDGPFIWKQTASGTPDSLSVTVSGNQTADFEVTPYYMIRNAQIAAAGSNNITATCSLEKIINDANAKDVEYVALYVNNTQFVSGINNVVSASIAGADISDDNNVQLSVTVPSLVPAQNYVFARIGLKMVNVEDLIFSPLVKITF
ncbi:DUF3823 domain-containing protein [Ilyomonas limi]|uniref:DUF3823 domain-containing protein n=1 Tax=Ilyomonas limi TaxID=2575867 RepID=A0A4U3L944_9BACT|nr:DUF3823 domain-containing protein [Ilyomonas limi]TKK70227.1 DUF3823 domain-containing protein [Ilyomonas limi]